MRIYNPHRGINCPSVCKMQVDCTISQCTMQMKETSAPLNDRRKMQSCLVCIASFRKQMLLHCGQVARVKWLFHFGFLITRPNCHVNDGNFSPAITGASAHSRDTANYWLDQIGLPMSGISLEVSLPSARERLCTYTAIGQPYWTLYRVTSLFRQC